jgi:hypothetical protein
MAHNPMEAHTQQGQRVGPGAQDRSGYLSYVLRLFRVDDEERPAWRISLQSSLTGEREGFASLDDLIGFLRREMGMTSDAAGEGRRRSG